MTPELASMISKHTRNVGPLDGEALYLELRRMMDECDQATGFASGDRFATDADVRAYLKAAEQRGMFGDDACVDQQQLDAWAEMIIASRWHMRLRCHITIDVEFAGSGWVRDGAIVDCPAILHDDPDSCEWIYGLINDDMYDHCYRGSGSVEAEGHVYGWRIER